jgi:hypothetical protein
VLSKSQSQKFSQCWDPKLGKAGSIGGFSQCWDPPEQRKAGAISAEQIKQPESINDINENSRHVGGGGKRDHPRRVSGLPC